MVGAPEKDAVCQLTSATEKDIKVQVKDAKLYNRAHHKEAKIWIMVQKI